MIIIGLTGPTGAGKTAACDTFRRLGAGVINADATARKVTRKGMPVLQKLAEAFGDDILAGGELDRRLLARRAFENKDNTERLNSIIFPFIIEQLRQEIEALKEFGYEVAVLDAPTLFESGCNTLCDVTLAILSSSSLRLPRIIERDSLNESDALVRMSAEKDQDFYKSRAQFILYNEGSLSELGKSIEDFYAKLKI